MADDKDQGREVARIPGRRPTLKIGKPTRIITSSSRGGPHPAQNRFISMRQKVASTQKTSSGFGGGGMGASGGTVGGGGGNFYSPELSTDFLELPQSIDEKRNYFRFFYENDPFVGQAIDVHTEIPLSKVRIGMPKAKNRELAEKSYRFITKWAKRISGGQGSPKGLLHRLLEIIHDYFLIGEVFVFCEDLNTEMPQDIRERLIREVNESGAREYWQEREDADERAVGWLKKNYKGWSTIRVLPPEQVHMESFPLTDARIFELIPDSKSRKVVEQAQMGDERALKTANAMSPLIVDAILRGENLPLNTDPAAGSFVFYLARKKSQYEPRGHSILERCLLPGSLVTIKRGNLITMIPVEDVDTTTDLLLTHEGRFQKAVGGSREVSEYVSVIHVDGIHQPLALTEDHRVLRVIDEEGNYDWPLSSELKTGDLVREAHVKPEGPALTEINLTKWWEGRSFQVGRRFRENKAGFELAGREIRTLESSREDDGSLMVTLEHDQDDAGRIQAVQKTEKVLGWLKSLKEPTASSYGSLAAVLGLKKSEVANSLTRIKQAYNLKTGKASNRSTIWHPVDPNLPVPGAKEIVTLTSPVSSIKINEDFCYLMGSWLGDGDIWTSDEHYLNTPWFGWSFGKEERAVQERVARLALQVFGGENLCTDHPYGKDREDATTNYLSVNDQLLSRWVFEEFGHKAQGKKIPDWIFGLSENCILALLRGMLDTDGCLTVDYREMVEIQLDNEQLLRQFHLLCCRVGLVSSVRPSHRKARDWTRRWMKEGKWVEKTYHYEPKTFWRLSCCNSPDVRKWAAGSVKGSRVGVWPDRQARKSKFRGGWLTRKIKKVEREFYAGPVYSFDVEGDASHTVNSVSVHNCLQTLVFRDKLRQAQTSIASRHMTPMRLIYAEDMSAGDVEELRLQVDMALEDPDYSIITNFQVNWEEMGSNDRLLDLTSEYDLTDRQLYAGLGVTESLLSGESSYSGDRINLEVINTRYMLLRELVCDFCEEYLFRPMCERMGFVEEDEDGDEVVIIPSLSFTRLALRDNQDTFDALFNLYQKGSLDIDVILEQLNLDPIAVREKLEKDMLTPNDATFNEVLRGIYSDVGRMIAENSDAAEKIAAGLGLKYEVPGDDDGGGRF